MKRKLQIIDWNFCWHGYNKKKLEFLFSIVEENTCIMLQEVMSDVFDYIKNTYGDKYNFIYSLDYREPGLFDTNARKLGVVIACSKNIKILDSGVIERNLFPDRTAWAVVDFEGREIKILALHSITGCGYYKAKSIQYDTFIEFMEEFNPDIIGIDANEPKIDSYDVDKMEFYENGNGAGGFFRSTKRKGLVDAYVKANNITECEEGKYLTTSHIVRRKGPVRYDFLFINNNMDILSCDYLYEESIKADSDHALIVARIEI